MRKLTRKEIKIRFGIDRADQIKTAYIGKHLGVTYTVRRVGSSAHPFILLVNRISDFGYVGITHSFGLLRHAERHAHAQIDAVFGIDEVSHV